METIAEHSVVLNSIIDKIKNNNKRSGIEKLNNINPILDYCYIWNCIYGIMQKRKDLKCCFDGKIGYKLDILCKDNIFVTDQIQYVIYSKNI